MKYLVEIGVYFIEKIYWEKVLIKEFLEIFINI
jgi:hypothetical protein